MEFLFQPRREENDQEDGDDATPARDQGIAEQIDLSQVGVAEDGRHDATQHRRAAEFFGRIDADEDVQTIEGGVAGNGQDLHERLGSQRWIHLESDIEQARNQATGDEGRDDGYEDMGNLF